MKDQPHLPSKAQCTFPDKTQVEATIHYIDKSLNQCFISWITNNNCIQRIWVDMSWLQIL